MSTKKITCLFQTPVPLDAEARTKTPVPSDGEAETRPLSIQSFDCIDKADNGGRVWQLVLNIPKGLSSKSKGGSGWAVRAAKIVKAVTDLLPGSANETVRTAEDPLGTAHLIIQGQCCVSMSSVRLCYRLILFCFTLLQ